MIKIELSNDDLQSLVALIDAGVKAVGLQSVKTAAVVLAKLEMAVAEANAANKEPE